MTTPRKTPMPSTSSRPGLRNTARINVPSKSESIGTCLHCNNDVFKINQYLKCLICKKFIHLSCCQGKYDHINIKKAVDTKSNLGYACDGCRKLQRPNVNQISLISKKQAIKEGLSKLEPHIKDTIFLKAEIHKIHTELVVLEFNMNLSKSNKRRRANDSNEFEFCPQLQQKVLPICDSVGQKIYQATSNLLQMNLENYTKRTDEIINTCYDIYATKREDIPPDSSPSSQDVNFLSFAEVVNLSEENLKCKKKVSFNVAEEDKSLMIESLFRDNSCNDIRIRNIQRKSDGTEILVTCDDISESEKLKKKLEAKFGETIKVNDLEPYCPLLKIVRIPCSNMDKNDIKTQLLAQNKWLSPFKFEVLETYEIRRKNLSYTNAILTCDIELLKLFLSHGKIIFGFATCYCFEQVRLLQCNNCQKFGHVRKYCKIQPACKYCSESHISETCPELYEHLSCINCIRSNKKGKNYFTEHLATDPRCLTRNERIFNIKLSIMGNSKISQ